MDNGFMHPTDEIRGIRSDLLEGKRIVIGVTGSIAAVECVKLARGLIRHGAEVHAVMTPEAQKIIGDYAMGFATANRVITELTGEVEHVSLCGDVEGRADLLLISPCTANTLGKIVHGLDDTPVTTFATTAIGTGIPLILVPAMHNTMYEHPVVEENLKKAREMGIEIVDPVVEEKKAKMAPVDEIVDRVIRKLHRGSFDGKNVLVVTGATKERIDDMRYITNRSTGVTGIEISREAFYRGADTMLLAGENVRGIPSSLETMSFSDVEDLSKKLDLIQNSWKVPDIAFFAAGISDYAPDPVEGKIESGEETIDLKLRRTRKVIDKFKGIHPDCILIGYKAERVDDRKELMRRAYKRMKKVGMDLVVANDLKDVKEEENKVVVINKNKDAFEIQGTKAEIARFLLDKVEELIK